MIAKQLGHLEQAIIANNANNRYIPWLLRLGHFPHPQLAPVLLHPIEVQVDDRCQHPCECLSVWLVCVMCGVLSACFVL